MLAFFNELKQPFCIHRVTIIRITVGFNIHNLSKVTHESRHRAYDPINMCGARINRV